MFKGPALESSGVQRVALATLWTEFIVATVIISIIALADGGSPKRIHQGGSVFHTLQPATTPTLASGPVLTSRRALFSSTTGCGKAGLPRDEWIRARAALFAWVAWLRAVVSSSAQAQLA